jgi:arginine:pyruvate transaminase
MASPTFATTTQRIAGEGSAAWDIHYRALDMAKKGDDIVILSVGDPDFDTPLAIVDGAVSSLRDGHTHYSDHRGNAELRHAIAHYHNQQTQQRVSADQVLVVAGAQCGLYTAAQCILESGDEVIVPEPMYVTYEAFLGATGASIINVPLSPDDHFQINVDSIAAAVSPKTKAIVINSPHNPTGASVDKRSWQGIAEICLRHNLWLVVDEVYSQLVFDGEHINPASFEGMADRTIIINSLSKSHAMTGWRLGWIIGPEAFIEHAGNLALCMLYGSPTFVQDAAKIAIEQPIAEVAEMRAAYLKRRDALLEALEDTPGVKAHKPAGGMFVMLDIRDCKVSAQAFAEILLDEFGVSVLVGEAFGPSAAGHVRCSLAVDEHQLRRAAARIKQCAAHFLKN